MQNHLVTFSVITQCPKIDSWVFCMKFTTFFTHIMFLNNMGAQGIRHVINIMGYARDIPVTEPTLQAANYALLHQREVLSFGLHILQTKRMYK